MGERVYRFGAAELTRIRLKLDNGIIHEVPLGEIYEYAQSSVDPNVKKHLAELANALTYFSDEKNYPGIEFTLNLPDPSN